MAVIDSDITATTAANFIPQIWSDGVVEAVEFAGTIQKRVNRGFESDLKIGNTLNVPRLSNLTTQSKTAGIANTINFEAITEGVQQVTVATHEYAAFLVESVVEVQANQDVRSRYEKKIGYAVARGREVTLANLFQNLSTNIVGTYGVELTADDYLSGWQKLSQAGLLEESTDPGEDFSLFLSPAAYVAAMKVDIFGNQLYNPGAEVISKAHVGQIYGFGAYLSNLLQTPGANQHSCAMIHKDCFALIVQEEIPVQSQFLIRNIGDGVVGWNLYGTARILFPPETPGGGVAVDNRGVLLQTL